MDMPGHYLPSLEKVPKASHDLYHANRQKISLLINDFLLQYLNTLYVEFNGDIVLAIILGELAHQNVSPIFQRGHVSDRFTDKHLDFSSLKDILTPCNPFSISEATGIPRETVRRKFADLVKRGWVERVSPRSYIITQKAPEAFVHGFHVRLFEGVRDLCTQLQAITGK